MNNKKKEEKEVCIGQEAGNSFEPLGRHVEIGMGAGVWDNCTAIGSGDVNSITFGRNVSGLHKNCIVLGSGAKSTESDSIVLKTTNGTSLEVRNCGSVLINGEVIDPGVHQDKIVKLLCSTIQTCLMERENREVTETFLEANSTAQVESGSGPRIRYKLDSGWYSARF